MELKKVFLLKVYTCTPVGCIDGYNKQNKIADLRGAKIHDTVTFSIKHFRLMKFSAALLILGQYFSHLLVVHSATSDLLPSKGSPAPSHWPLSMPFMS